MKIKIIPLLIYTLSILALASCRQEDGSPIRNVRFDPNLLNQSMDGSPCASYSYFYGNEQTSLGSVYTKQILVSFAKGSTYDEQKAAVEKYGFINSLGSPTSTNSATLYTLELVDGLNCKQAEQAIHVLANDQLVSYTAPYFVKDDNLLGVSNEAIVTVRSGSQAALIQLLQGYNAAVVAKLSDAVYIVKVDKNSDGNALELANYLQAQESITHAEPDFVVSLVPARPGLNRGADGKSKADFTR
ncbi:hypothetical protein ABID22_002952 [Pontibacter aydingkolensis]|uniref:Fasciclin domain-containing protein n=1 Tax=Pontibacter aydingkolensis TaxID=1911536 RepID=A0ABS7CUS0_9BACT|nr:hypothetical protein [Pontibacter aydingkolensis]MBW7467535.1 hypothetical protein [Pontibacter aydingkolensis]